MCVEELLEAEEAGCKGRLLGFSDEVVSLPVYPPMAYNTAPTPRELYRCYYAVLESASHAAAIT